ncbi:MAG TPA: ROK family protein, partial [Steroidobacteraceae bacterium]
VIEFFERTTRKHGRLAGIGIAAFGPVDLDRGSPTWGRLLATPKPGWSNFDLVAPFRRFGCPVAIDTDVNAAALAEATLGAGVGLGGGVVTGGELLPHIRRAARQYLGGYLPVQARAGGFDRYISAPALADFAGTAGALLLAMQGSA